jgi:hypothetical protein
MCVKKGVDLLRCMHPQFKMLCKFGCCCLSVSMHRVMFTYLHAIDIMLPVCVCMCVYVFVYNATIDLCTIYRLFCCMAALCFIQTIEHRLVIR